MSSQSLAIAVMLNNYTHDLATALFAVSVLAAWLLQRELKGALDRGAIERLTDRIVRLGYFALAWTLAAGVVRALAFKRFEWSEAAGAGLVPVLIVKHVILVSMVTAGVVVLVKIRRRRKASEGLDGPHQTREMTSSRP